jgi:CRP-like cAMP-binding protein
MDSKLKFLTDEDYQLFLEKAKVATYPKNATILEEGVLSPAIYILCKGSVRVEHSKLGQGVAIAFLFPGDIFGEMSFVEDIPASATIIAEEEVEVFIIETTILYSLLVSIPGLSTRFYQSIASNLSHRLRETSLLVSSLLEKSSFESQFHTRRTGYFGQDCIPAELISEVELFKDNLVEIEQSLRRMVFSLS